MGGHANRLRSLLAILIILSGSATIQGCCRSSKPVYPTLVIDDPDTAVWMNTTNTFILAPGAWFADPSKQLWQGVLIQLGNAESPTGANPLDVLVRITPDTGTQKGYLLKDLSWINVQARNPQKDPPMQPAHAGQLWSDPSTPTMCQELEACEDKNCLCPNPPCNNNNQLGLVPGHCLRLRSLHAYFKPLAIITYWIGPNGYELRMEGNLPDPKQVFSLKDPVDVSVTQKNGAVDQFSGVKTIEIRVTGVPTHRRIQDPPANG
jgi:hypothetical protein